MDDLDEKKESQAVYLRYLSFAEANLSLKQYE